MAVSCSLLFLSAALQPPARRSRPVPTHRPGGWSADRQRDYHAAVARRVLTRGGHGGDGRAVAGLTGIEQLDTDYAGAAAADDRRREWQGRIGHNKPSSSAPLYSCAVCALTFDRKKQLEEHLAGKKHRAAEAAAAGHWAAFQRSSWSEASLALDEQRALVTCAFSLPAFLDGLPSRSRADGSGVAPHVTISSLAPHKRLMLWRYLRELMPSRPLLPEVFAQLERHHGRFARVKEILESGQVFAEAEQAVLRSDPDAVVQRGKAATRRGRSCSPSVQRAVDVACGHGLVGLLLAYRFPALSVVGVDRRQRPAYTAYVDAWRATHRSAGAAGAGEGDVLGNAQFVEGEAADLVSGEPPVRVDGETFALCVHGCNEVNVEAVEMARECGASWMVVPCCLKTELYVQLESMRLTDAMQYAFLCGSMAKAYRAERVATLDARVTPRSIVLSGGGRDQRERAREDRVA
mmetsp:Transcript_7965/g.26327  ORF Transcript_7965/g.26327 Transcript_7965/m.26327 type:complete len:463 (-) Transcript_7965:72-1460(-)